MESIKTILNDEDIQKEYETAVLLSMFKAVCVKGKNDDCFRRRIYTLFRESLDRKATIKAIIKKEVEVELTNEEAQKMEKWFIANENKKPRKHISEAEKYRLLKEQNYKCNICGADLSNSAKKIHVDHIIPYELVGDELEDNLQCLCETCNECKNSKIDFILLKKLRIR